MTMKYRGISYDMISTTSTLESEVVEGIYHGLQMEIHLPEQSSPNEMFKDLIMYRGAKL